MKIRIAAAVWIVLLTFQPDTATGQPGNLPVFENLTDVAAVANRNESFGVAVADIDNDGFPDIFVANANGSVALYRNNRNNRFIDLTTAAGLGALTGRNATFGDFDNDGSADLLLDGRLFRNVNGQRFSEITTEAGLGGQGGFGQVVLDADNDGWLDIFIAAAAPLPNRLYRNNADGTFTDIAREAGVADSRGQSGGATAADVDGNGFIDIYLAYSGAQGMGAENVLYLNSGDGTFKDGSKAMAVDHPGSALGAAFGDLNNDGFPELYIGNRGSSDVLLLNRGDGTFADITKEAGIEKGDTRTPVFADFNNDGWLDLYLAGEFDGNKLYLNEGGARFTEVTGRANAQVFANCNGAAALDFDVDGNVDLYIGTLVSETSTQNALLRNNGVEGNWLHVDVQHPARNRDGIGAKVRVVAGELAQVRVVDGGHGAGSQNSPRLHFGLGSQPGVDSLIVRWPNGGEFVQTDPPINQVLPVREETGAQEPIVFAPETATAGESVAIAAVPPPSFGATDGSIFFRRARESGYQSVALSVSENQFAGAIPPDFVTIRGVEYYLAFGNGNVTLTFPAANPETTPVFLPVTATQVPAQVRLQPGIFRMVSAPLLLEQPSVDDVLGDDYGAYDQVPRSWRVFRWQNGEYAEYQQIDAVFSPGVAFWLITRSGQPFVVDNAISVAATQPFDLLLQPGWNQVATPFAFPVAWSDVSASGAVQTPVFFDGSTYQFDVAVLQPWEGYFLFNLEEGPVTLSFAPVEAQQVADKPRELPWALGAADYILRLSTTVGRENRSLLHAGILDAASDGLDAFDRLMPPPIIEGLRFVIRESDYDFAANFKAPHPDGRRWLLEVQVPLPGMAIELALTRFGELPPGHELYLLDLDQRRALAVDDGPIRLDSERGQSLRRFELIAGAPAFAAAGSDGIPLVPQAFALAQNYPNPFNPVTTIRFQLGGDGPVKLAIYDLTGSLVRVLVDGWRAAGSYEVQWPGDNAQGVPIASGVYYARIETATFAAVRKLVLVR